MVIGIRVQCAISLPAKSAANTYIALNGWAICGCLYHHLDGTGEHENKNHSLENLMTVCNKCHRLFHAKVNVVFREGKFSVAGEIFDKLGIEKLETTAVNVVI